MNTKQENYRKARNNQNWLLWIVILIVLVLVITLFTLHKRQEKTDTNQTTTQKTKTIHPAALNELQIPATKPGEEIVRHTGYTLSYNEEHEQANWVAYILTGKETQGKHYERSNHFMPDPSISSGSADDADYDEPEYDRGHLAPAEDMAWSKTTMDESFYYSNMSPQVPAFNRGVWRRLEELVRFWSTTYDSIYIVTGPVLTSGLPVIGHDRVSVPRYFYKVILEYGSKGTQGIGFILPNQASSATLKSFAVSIDSVEHLTGINFFPDLPDNEEEAIEGHVDVDQWKWTRRR
jgi:endonuclease G